MKPSTSLPSILPLVLGVLALVLFIPGLKIMDATRAWMPTLYVAAPAMLLAAGSLAAAVWILRGKPSGRVYGLAMTGGITGGFALIFWVVMVPMLLIVALPAREADPVDPAVEQSRRQMKVLVRQVKSFQREHGRLPVKLAELVEKEMIPTHLLYDPRQARRDAPSYRLMVRDMPPKAEWAATPLLEGRIPDREGFRLLAYPDESLGTVRP